MSDRPILESSLTSSEFRRWYWMKHELVEFNIHMRDYLALDAPKTLGDAVAHWHETRRKAKPDTLPQLEFVRFTKAWLRAHPDGTAAECRAAWKRHRSLPIDERADRSRA